MGTSSAHTIGLEFDNSAIRGAKCLGGTLRAGAAFKAVDRLIEIRGDYSREESLIEGFKQVREKLDAGGSDRFVTCVAGKQVFTGQIPFRKLGHTETLNALRFELRKSAPFDLAGATIDWQEVEGNQDDSGEGKVHLLASAVSGVFMNRHLTTLAKVGIKPWIVDTLPLAIANSFWIRCQVDSDFGVAHVILHTGPGVCTLVIDGIRAPFYTRSIHFSAAEVLGEGRDETPERERERRLAALCDEVQRSLSFYEKTAGDVSFDALHLIGDYAANPDLKQRLDNAVGLLFAENDLLKYLEINGEPPVGKFDVAIALALRNL